MTTSDEIPDLFFEDAILTRPGESLIETVQKARSEAHAELDSLLQWLWLHEGDVDHSAFVKACDKVAILASQEAKIRHPDSLRGMGYVTLDYAAALMGTYIPSTAMFGGLPGFFEPDQGSDFYDD